MDAPNCIQNLEFLYNWFRKRGGETGYWWPEIPSSCNSCVSLAGNNNRHFEMMAPLISFAFVLILSSSFFLASSSALSYHGNGRNYTLWTGTQGECPLLTDDGSKLYKCLTEVPVLNKLPWIISNVMQDSDPVYNHDFLLCRHQNNICRSILEYKDHLSPICNSSFVGCQSALRHLHAMMFTADKTQQQCNNFALKSVRAFFHDYMSSAIDGSLLSEMDVEMNVGLCRFSQYVNVLSDKTLCDPGSIIALAGMLGFEACGVKLWELDQDVKPPTSIGRGYSRQRLYSTLFGGWPQKCQ